MDVICSGFGTFRKTSGIIAAVVNKTMSFAQSNEPSDPSTGFSVYVGWPDITINVDKCYE